MCVFYQVSENITPRETARFRDIFSDISIPGATQTPRQSRACQVSKSSRSKSFILCRKSAVRDNTNPIASVKTKFLQISLEKLCLSHSSPTCLVPCPVCVLYKLLWSGRIFSRQFPDQCPPNPTLSRWSAPVVKKKIKLNLWEEKFRKSFQNNWFNLLAQSNCQVCCAVTDADDSSTASAEWSSPRESCTPWSSQTTSSPARPSTIPSRPSWRTRGPL